VEPNRDGLRTRTLLQAADPGQRAQRLPSRARRLDLGEVHRWSDCHGDLDSVFDRDDLLTNLTIYWATRTIGSSMRLYYETAHSTSAGYGRVEIPTGMVMSSADMFPTPREWVERQYNVIHWTDLPRGGHFLEWEVPDLIADDLRTFFNSHRKNTGGVHL
jgi:pimeloyl-ACP methyl ester carboxylesterase